MWVRNAETAQDAAGCDLAQKLRRENDEGTTYGVRRSMTKRHKRSERDFRCALRAGLQTSEAHGSGELSSSRPTVAPASSAVGRRRQSRVRKDGTTIGSGNLSTVMTAVWWHSSQVIESEHTPFARMLASVIGEPR
jgi:hypothetical protein